MPTTGFFKDIECPYNDSVCERPYCHFRHKKKNQEPQEEPPAAGTSEAPPTYKPTPKSQLANTRSHIPISYVPDVITRKERSNRILSYNPCKFEIKATYKPTPLSILSSANKQDAEKNTEYSPKNHNLEENLRLVKEASENESNDTFEDFSKECDLIDEIINESSETAKEECDKTKKEKESKKPSSSKSKHDKEHASKSKDSKHKNDYKKERHKHKSREKERRSSNESKSKKTSSSRDRKHNGRKKHDSKSKYREKEQSKERKDKEKARSKEKTKHKSDMSKASIVEESNAEENKPVYIPTKINKPFNEEDDYDNIELFDDDIEEECYKIFQEYKPEQKKPSPEPRKAPVAEEVEPYVPTTKKRIAYHNADQNTPKLTHTKPKDVPNAALVMANRFKLARIAQSNNEQKNLIAEIKKQGIKRAAPIESQSTQSKLTKTHETTKPTTDKTGTSSSLVDQIINSRTKTIRINPVQNVSSIQRAKAKIDELARKNALNIVNYKTPSQTISKGSKRQAHVPDVSLSELPDVLHYEKSKLPINVRTRYLTMLAEECVKLYLCKEDAYKRALNEELKVYERCTALNTYRNSGMLAVNRLRKELQEREKSNLGPIESGESPANESNSPFKGKTFYENVLGYVLTEEELVDNGYPREGEIPGKAIAKGCRVVTAFSLEENQRQCARCSKVYLIDRKGFALYPEDCIYHPLKKRTFRGESSYLCCKSNDETGCVTSNTHVSEESADRMLDGYQTTMEPEDDNDPRNYGVYALDCEMCYTTKGLELTRVTIVDSDCKTIYESLVKPLNPIIDYNTRFSGITKEQMDRTSTSILQVQANILHLCNSRTILIGHSLESDLKALKIVHSTVIDTAVLFPHKLGLPHKKALRVLASEYLKKIIQNDVAGHDSAEDALTCMELILYKLKEELKTRNLK